MIKFLLFISSVILTLSVYGQNWASFSVGYNSWHGNPFSQSAEGQSYRYDGYPSLSLGGELSSLVSENKELGIGASVLQSRQISIHRSFSDYDSLYRRYSTIQDLTAISTVFQYRWRFKYVRNLKLILGVQSFFNIRLQVSSNNVQLKHNSTGDLIVANQYGGNYEYFGLVWRNSAVQLGVKYRVFSMENIGINILYSLQIPTFGKANEVPYHQLKFQFYFQKTDKGIEKNNKPNYRLFLRNESFFRFVSYTSHGYHGRKIGVDKFFEIGIKRRFVTDRLNLGVGVGSLHEYGDYRDKFSFFSSIKTAIKLKRFYLVNDVVLNKNTRSLSNSDFSILSIHRIGFASKIANETFTFFASYLYNYSDKLSQVGLGLSAEIQLLKKK